MELPEPDALVLWSSQLVLSVVFFGWLRLAAWRGFGSWLRWTPALVLASAAVLLFTFKSGIDADEVEHLNLAFLMGDGQLPYRDISQNHAPALWIVLRAVLDVVPETPQLMLAFRGLALLSSMAGVWLVVGIARRGALSLQDTAAPCAFLALTIGVQAEVYRLRPDPFMTTLALASIALLLRSGESTRKRLFVAGLLQGLATAFSPKVIHLALLAPLVVLLLGAPRPAQLLVSYGLGLAAGVLPAVGWIFWHDIEGDAWRGLIARNLNYGLGRWASGRASLVGERDFSSLMSTNRIANLGALLCLGAAGAWLAWRKPGSGATHRRLFVAVCAAWGSVWFLSANLLTYHITGALLMTAVLGSWAIDWIGSKLQNHMRDAALALAMTLCVAGAGLRPLVGGYIEGHTYPLEYIDALYQAVGQHGGKCLCPMPFHPIFLDSASPVVKNHSVGHSKFRLAVDWALSERPGVMVFPVSIKVLGEDGGLRSTQVDGLRTLLSTEYQNFRLGTLNVWLRQAVHK